jgi:hypothetical protein
VLVTGGSAGQGPLGADCNTAYVVFQANAKLQVGGNVVITSGSASSASVSGSGKHPPALPPLSHHQALCCREFELTLCCCCLS